MQKGAKMYFRVCKRCGDNLDPGERCTCLEREEVNKQLWASLTCINEKGQLVLREMEVNLKNDN